MPYFIIGIDIDTLAMVIKTFLGIFCHQDESILLSMYGDYLQLCPRCIGLHSGFFTTIVLLVFINLVRPLILKEIPKIILVLLITVAGLHWLGGTTNMFDTNSFTRFFTGLISGSAFGYLIYFYHTLNKITFIRSSWTASIILFITIPFLLAAFIFEGSTFFNYSLGFILFFNTLTLFKTLVSIFQRTIKYQPQLNNMEVLK
jgi:uncharacterized membrane protein